jgi:hypothetical protein
MPGVLQKVKTRALYYRYKSTKLTYKNSGLTVAALYGKCIWRRVREGGGVCGGRARGMKKFREGRSTKNVVIKY